MAKENKIHRFVDKLIKNWQFQYILVKLYYILRKEIYFKVSPYRKMRVTNRRDVGCDNNKQYFIQIVLQLQFIVAIQCGLQNAVCYFKLQSIGTKDFEELHILKSCVCKSYESMKQPDIMYINEGSANHNKIRDAHPLYSVPLQNRLLDCNAYN